MGFLDLTEELLRKVDFAKSKIVQPQKLVFVCGGKKSGYTTKPTSMREVLLARSEQSGEPGHLCGAHVILAEAAVDFLAESSFTNLLDLERFIAATVNAVVLVVESPGSMCELGAFVMAEEIREKLIVVMQSDHMVRSSFINSGAIKYFRQNQKDAQVLGCDWKTNPSTSVITVPDYAIEAILNQLSTAMDAVRNVHIKELFNINMKGHLVYLTLAFCHLLRAAKKIDIKQCFEFASIEITEKDLKHSLDILQICKLVKAVRHVKLDYYVAMCEHISLEIAFCEGTHSADRSTSRWITRIVEAIRKDNVEKFRLEMFRGRKND